MALTITLKFSKDSVLEKHRGVVVTTTTQLHATKPELKFCAGSNPARGVSKIRDGEDLWQWSRQEIRLNAFRRSIIPQNNSVKELVTMEEDKIVLKTGPPVLYL